MKHLLIILSILLLSSPVIGEETLPVSGGKGVTLYEWETSSGETIPSTKVWKYFGDKKTQPVYKGEVENGVPNGLGIMIFPKGRWKQYKEKYKYVGSWKDGRYNGYGIERYYDGSGEVGEWKNGKEWNTTFYNKEGYVTHVWANGKRIEE